MSLPSVVLSSSSILCAKMDGVRGSQKSNPLWRTQGDSESWLIFPGFGGGALCDWGSSFYVCCFQDLLGVLFYFVIFYSWVFLYTGLIDYERKMSNKNFNESPYQRGRSCRDKIHVKNLKPRCIISLVPSEVSLPSRKSKNSVFETRENLGIMHACITGDDFIESSNIFLMERFPCIKSSCNMTEASFSKNLQVSDWKRENNFENNR